MEIYFIWGERFLAKENKQIQDVSKKVQKQALLNNLEPGESVNEHREYETGHLIQAEKEIGQQNNNL